MAPWPGAKRKSEAEPEKSFSFEMKGYICVLAMTLNVLFSIEAWCSC